VETSTWPANGIPAHEHEATSIGRAQYDWPLKLTPPWCRYRRF